MKIDKSRLKKSTSEVPVECQALIDKLRGCTNKDLLVELKKIDTWTFGKCELYHWIDILDMSDSILEEAAARQGTSWILACDLPENSEEKELLLWILHFTTLLIEHSFSRHLYSSMEHLITLLSSCDMNVVLGVLNLVYMFSKRSNFITRLGNEKRQALINRLTYLAESWGGKENGFGLAQCSRDAPILSFPPTATTLHFEFYPDGTEEPATKGKTASNQLVVIHMDNIDKLKKMPSEIMDQLMEQFKIPADRQMQLYTHIRLACSFSSWPIRLLSVQARLQALSVLVYSNALADNAHTLLYTGILEELVELLELQYPYLMEIRAAALRTLTSIIHLDRNPHFPKKPGSRLNMIIDVTGANSYHGFLPALVRTCIASLTSRKSANSTEPAFPLPLATALFSFLYHLASYEAGGESLVSCGMMESLLRVINWPGRELEHITFVTRAVRVIDLITNIDMQAFQTHGGLSSFINRLEMEVKVCRKEQPFEIKLTPLFCDENATAEEGDAELGANETAESDDWEEDDLSRYRRRRALWRTHSATPYDRDVLVNSPMRFPDSPTAPGYYPMANLDSPKANVHGPMTNLDSPKANVHGPMTNLDSPKANVHDPVTNLDSPMANVYNPMANLNSPLANAHDPVANLDSPMANVHDPMANLDSPMANEPEFVANLNSPMASDWIDMDTNSPNRAPMWYESDGTPELTYTMNSYENLNDPLASVASDDSMEMSDDSIPSFIRDNPQEHMHNHEDENEDDMSTDIGDASTILNDSDPFDNGSIFTDDSEGLVPTELDTSVTTSQEVSFIRDNPQEHMHNHEDENEDDMSTDIGDASTILNDSDPFDNGSIFTDDSEGLVPTELDTSVTTSQEVSPTHHRTSTPDPDSDQEGEPSGASGDAQSISSMSTVIRLPRLPEDVTAAIASTSAEPAFNSTSPAQHLPDFSAASKTGKTCLPQRAALLKSMLNFLKKAIQDPAFSDSIRHVMEGSLPASLKHVISNAEYYGPSLFLLATDVVTAYVFQEPSLLSSLQDNGLTDVVLYALLAKDVPATREVLGSLPNVFSALCLNARGLSMFVTCDPFERLFKVLLSPTYLAAMRRRRSSDPMGDTASNLGNAMDELMRHQPILKVEAITAIIKLLKELWKLGNDPKYVCWRAQKGVDAAPSAAPGQPSAAPNDPGSSDEEDEDEEEASTSSHPQRDDSSGDTAGGPNTEKSPIALIDYILNVTKFVDAILSNNSTDDHCKEFVRQEGLGPLISILALPNLPVDYPVSTAAQGVASVCKSILNLAHEPEVLKEGLRQLGLTLERLGPLHKPIKEPGSSVLLRELASAPNLDTAFSTYSATPLLHSMGAVHGFVVMFVHVCRTGQSDIRTLSLVNWGSPAGLSVLRSLAELYVSLVWESTLLLALCSDDIIPAACQFGAEDMARLLPAASETKPETEPAATDTASNGMTSAMEALSTDPVVNMDVDDSEKSKENRAVPTMAQLRLIKPLLGASSRLGRALAELFGLLVKLCVGSPIRARRGQVIPNQPTVPTPSARAVAATLNELLARGLAHDKLPHTTITKFKLTFLICSVGFTSPMLFDEKKYPYHLMLHKFVQQGGQQTFFQCIQWALTSGDNTSEDSTEEPSLPEGTGEFLDASLILLEKMVNPKAILDSPHTTSGPKSSTFDPLKYLLQTHQDAFRTIMLLWGKKPIKAYGARMSESMLAILRHILRGEKIIAERLCKEQMLPSDDAASTSTAAAGAGAAGPSLARRPPREAPPVNADHLHQLMDMGFTREHCRDALVNCSSLEAATDYLLTTPAGAARPGHQNVSMELDEEDQMIRAIAMSLGEKVEKAAKESVSISRAEQMKEDWDVLTKFQATIEVFTQSALTTCLALLDTLPDTVYRIGDLLFTIAKRNGDAWRDNMLHVLMGEISAQVDQLFAILGENSSAEDIVKHLATSEAATMAAGRIHLFTLLFEGPVYTELRIPCARVLHEVNIAPRLVELLRNVTLAMGCVEEPPTPKWLAPMLLLIDLLEKVSVCTRRKEQMHKVTNRTWRWFDLTAGKWTTYTQFNNKIINDAYWKGEQAIRINCGRRRYTLKFNLMSQVNEESTNRRPITMSLLERERAEGKAEKKPASADDKSDKMEVEEQPTTPVAPVVADVSDEIAGLGTDDAASIVRSCVGLLALPVDKDTLHAVMRVCLRLTRDYDNARVFASEGGVRLLLDLSFYSSFTGFVCLATLIVRHVIEDPATLRLSMEKVLRAKTLANIPPGYKELLYMLRSVSPAVTRDPVAFLEVARRVLRVDCNILVRRNDEEDIRLLLKTLPYRQSTQAMQEEVATNAIYQLLDALAKSHPPRREEPTTEPAPTPVPGPSLAVAPNPIQLANGVLPAGHSTFRTNAGNLLGVPDEGAREYELERLRLAREELLNGKGTEDEKKRPLLPKSAILKLLAEAVRSYAGVARLVADYVYRAGQTPLATEECTALAFLLDHLLPAAGNPDDRECSTMARMLVAAIASCNHSPDAQTTLVSEVRNALLRTLSLPESSEKHTQIQLLAGLVSTMVENCPPTPNVPVTPAMKLNQYTGNMNNVVRIILRRGLLTDLARVSHHLDLSSPHTPATLNAALKPLETLSRIVNQPTTAPAVKPKAKSASAATAPSQDMSGGTSTSDATRAQGEETLEDVDNSELDTSSGALEPAMEAVPSSEGDDELIAEMLSREPDAVNQELQTSTDMDVDDEHNTSANPPFENDEDTGEDIDQESDSEDSSNASDDGGEVHDHNDEEDDDEDEGEENEDEENGSGYDEEELEFFESDEGLFRIPGLDRGESEDILMIQYADGADAGSLVPWNTGSFPLPFGLFEDPYNANENADGATGNITASHPLLMARHQLEMASLTTTRAQRANRQRRYQYLQLNPRNPNPPVILQRLLGPARDVHNITAGASQALASSFGDSRVVLMDNGLGILTHNEEEQIDFVDQSGYLFGPSLAATLSNVPTALHWWTEEAKILDGESQPACVTVIASDLVSDLEKYRDLELNERKEKRKRIQEEEDAKRKKEETNSGVEEINVNEISPTKPFGDETAAPGFEPIPDSSYEEETPPADPTAEQPAANTYCLRPDLLSALSTAEELPESDPAPTESTTRGLFENLPAAIPIPSRQRRRDYLTNVQSPDPDAELLQTPAHNPYEDMPPLIPIIARREQDMRGRGDAPDDTAATHRDLPPPPPMIPISELMRPTLFLRDPRLQPAPEEDDMQEEEPAEEEDDEDEEEDEDTDLDETPEAREAREEWYRQGIASPDASEAPAAVAGTSSSATAPEIPEGVDPSFLAALPDEMREEVIAEQLRLQRQRQQRAQVQTGEVEAAPLTEVNPEFLAALPPAIQEEVLAQQRQEQQRQAAIAANPNDPVDTAAFFENLQPSLRQAILTDMEESQIAALPPDLAQEAQSLRREWETRNRQLMQERFFSHVSHNNTALSSILRNSGAGRVGTRYAIHTVPPRAQWASAWNSRPDPMPAMGGESSNLPATLRLRGRQLLDHEAMSCLLVLLFVDEPKLNTGRLHRVLRNLCYHGQTRDWVIKALISIMSRCNECRAPEVAPSRRRMATRSQPASADPAGVNSVKSPPSWLNISLDAALGCRASVFSVSRHPGKRGKAQDTINIHPQAAPIVFRHTLEVLISLAKSFPRYFLPHKRDTEPGASPGAEKKAATRVARTPEQTDFWEMLVKLDSLTSKKGKSVARAHSSASLGIDELGNPTNFETSAFGQLMKMLSSPVVKRSCLLTDKLLRLLSLISIGLPDCHVHLHAEEAVPERHLRLAIEVLTSKSCSEEGLEDATGLLLNLSNCPEPTRDMIFHLLLQGALELSNMVNEHIQLLLSELKQMNVKMKSAEQEPGDTSPETLAIDKERPNRGILNDRFTKTSVVVSAPAKLKGGCDLQLPSMATLTSKTSSQAFFLRILKVITQIREAIRQSQKKQKTEAKRKLKSTLPQASSGETTTTAASRTLLAAGGSGGNRAPMTPEDVVTAMPRYVARQPGGAPMTPEEVVTAMPRFAARQPGAATVQAEPQDDTEEDDDDEPPLISLSELLSLDRLWNTLSSCLLELADTPDHHAVLVLQPAVEAFFLVHASESRAAPRDPAAPADTIHVRQPFDFDTADVAPVSPLEPDPPGGQPHTPERPQALNINWEVSPSPVNLPPDQQKFLKFAETHRTVLNQILRQSTTHLADGPFAVLVDHTRVLDFDVKRRYFRSELERLDDGVRREELAVHVRRSVVFEDSFRELHRRTADEWKNRFYIVFEGEEGQDAGGLLREWYVIISREIFNPMYALFTTSPGDRVTYMINSTSHCNPNHLCYFKFVGRVIAKAIYDNKLLECYFSRSFYKHILGILVKYTDMEAEDFTFYQSMVFLKENTVSEMGYELTFSTEVQEFGVTEVRDLIPNGRNIFVSENTKMDYIRLVCQMKMTGAIRKQINAFLEGFYDIIPKRLIAIFNEQELELLISGLPNVDIEDLRANTEYHKYQPTSLQIQWFWRALRAFDQADRAKFLQFVTGTSKVPLQGFAALEGMNGVQKFQIHRDDRSTDRLPSAHTCFNQLDLPVYETYNKLNRYLLKAIHECSEGFGFA